MKDLLVKVAFSLFSKKKEEPKLIQNDAQRDKYKADFLKAQALEDKAFAKYQKTQNDDDWNDYYGHVMDAYVSHQNYMQHAGAKVLSEYHHNL